MPKIIGNGAPTSSTPGTLGQEYFDKDSSTVYTCINVQHITSLKSGEMDEEYEWAVIGGGSGSYCIYMDSGKKFIRDNFDHNEFVKAVQENRPVLLVEVYAVMDRNYRRFYNMVEGWYDGYTSGYVGGYFYTSVFESPDFYGLMFKFNYNITTGEAILQTAQ